MSSLRYLALLLCFFALPLLHAQGQKTYIGYIYPTGGAQGSSVVVEFGGQKISDAKNVLVSGNGIKAEILPPLPPPVVEGGKKGKKGKKANKGKKKIITDEDNIQIADRLRVRFTIEKGAELGLRDIKVVGARGTISNRLFFEVSQFPNSVEKEPNGSLAEATPIVTLPTVVSGQVERGGRDWYRFSAKKGQSIVAAVKAQQLVPFLADAVPGWFQPVLAMYDAKGREVAFSDDYKLKPDPTIVYNVEEDGYYYLEIKDCIFRGREDFVYRISLGEIPHVAAHFPLGAKAGEPFSLYLMGVNLKQKKRNVTAPKTVGRRSISLKGVDGLSTNEIDIEISDDEEIVHFEDAGDTRAKAVSLKRGQVYNERITHDYDEDWIRLNLEEGENLKFDLLARRLGSPLDAELRLYDSRGKEIAKSDDFEDEREGLITHHADAQLIHKVQDSGTYFLRITDAQNKFGEDFCYRLRYYDSAEDFSLNITPSAISIPSGGTVHFTVFPVRMNGFKRPITLSAKDLPKGYVLSEINTIGKATKSLKMSITAPPGAPSGPVKFSLQGKATLSNGDEVVRIAQPAEPMMQAFFITHLLPIGEFRVDTTPAASFRIELDIPEEGEETLQLKGKDTISVPVRIIRKKGFTDEIELSIKGPKWVKSSNEKAGPDDDKVMIKLSCDKWNRANQRVTLHVSAVVGAKAIKGKVAGKRNQIATTETVISPLFVVRSPAKVDSTVKKNRKNQKNKKNNKSNTE